MELRILRRKLFHGGRHYGTKEVQQYRNLEKHHDGHRWSEWIDVPIIEEE